MKKGFILAVVVIGCLAATVNNITPFWVKVLQTNNETSAQNALGITNVVPQIRLFDPVSGGYYTNNSGRLQQIVCTIVTTNRVALKSVMDIRIANRNFVWFVTNTIGVQSSAGNTNFAVIGVILTNGCICTFTNVNLTPIIQPGSGILVTY